MTAGIDSFLVAHGDELIGVRRRIHSRPELGRAEFETTALIAQRLTAAGLAPRVLTAGTGVICDIGSGPGPVIALRADLDALPVRDDKQVDYRSTRDGVCHACGHDVHTAVVLGAALFLAQQHASLAGRVRVVFQPAEELTPGGALTVIDEGGLDDVGSIYAVHCDPRLAVGKVGTRSGPITAAADQVDITVTGPGGHTARPHLTTDLVYAAGRVITDLPAGMSRLVDPRAGLTLVFGAVHGGSAPNAIPERVQINGTLRVLTREAWLAAPELIERLLSGTLGALGASWKLDYQRGVPPVVNDVAATNLISGAAATALGAGNVVPTEQSMGGEDFAYYLEHVPGSLARLGTYCQGLDVDLHSGRFDIDERAIAVGVRLLAQTALDGLSAAVGEH
ncbi:MAG: amidohydrolase [Mycobacteriales bacterium]